MKLKKLITLSLLVAGAALTSSCGVLPDLPQQDVGPVSSESPLSWNQSGQGGSGGLLGALGGR